jgi:hypothetical protein
MFQGLETNTGEEGCSSATTAAAAAPPAARSVSYHMFQEVAPKSAATAETSCCILSHCSDVVVVHEALGFGHCHH